MEKGKRCAGCRKMVLAVCVLALVLGLTSCGTLGAPSGNFPDETSVVSGGNSLNETGMVSGLEEIPTVTGDLQVQIFMPDTLYAPKTWKEEDELSQYIVRGRLLDDAKQKLYYYTPKDDPSYGITVTSFEISQVYKGNMSPGDVIPLGEDYWTIEKKGKFIRYERYEPSSAGKEYILFLRRGEDSSELRKGLYLPTIAETGIYPVVDPAEFDVDSKTAKELNLVVRQTEDYRAIYKEVIRKYMR